MKANLHKDVMLCFPSAANVDEEYTENDGAGQRIKEEGPDEEGWTTVIPK